MLETVKMFPKQTWTGATSVEEEVIDVKKSVPYRFIVTFLGDRMLWKMCTFVFVTL